MERFILGIDVGGTFTDACAIGDRGTVLASKSPTTPPDFGRGVLNVITELERLLGAPPQQLLSRVSYVCHGTTVTLNALVTGEVERVGFMTTRGHADTIRIMNVEGRYTGLDADQLQDWLRTSKPDPLVPLSDICEIDERVDLHGNIVVRLNRAAVRERVVQLLDQGIRSIAVSLLWSFANPEHEIAVREIIHEINPDIYVSLSHEVSPRIGEYGRATTTIMSAQVGPTLTRYLETLTDQMRARGFAGKLLIMQGSGGVIDAGQAATSAIHTVASTLSGGVIGAMNLGHQLGDSNIIATDMGGTTFLTGMILDGEPITGNRALIGQRAVDVPMVQIHTIGSGGVAIAWLDAGNNLRVGPRSAGASPGPVAYDQGGIEPTITDANLVLGILDPATFLGGRMPLNRNLAEEAIRVRIAEPLSMTVPQAAMAIHTVANAQIADAIRQVVVNNGHDPRDFVVYAYGGGAPLHAARYTEEIGVSRLVIPLGSTASAFSAFGLATADVVITEEHSSPQNYPVSVDAVQAIFTRLETQAATKIKQHQFPLRDVTLRREIDVRFTLQHAELAVPVSLGPLTQADLHEVTRKFHSTYEQVFGRGTGFADAGFQFISYRVYASGRLTDARSLPPLPARAIPARPRSTRSVFLDIAAGYVATPVFHYAEISAGQQLSGPALIEAEATTVVVPAHTRATVDAFGNLCITQSKEG